VYASSADIFVDSGVLTGSGSLVANRDVEISILNKTPAYLRISGVRRFLSMPVVMFLLTMRRFAHQLWVG